MHVAIDSMNKCLTEVGVTPYSKTKACQPRYPEKKIDKITKAMRQLIVSAEPHDDESEILKQLKEQKKVSKYMFCPKTGRLRKFSASLV